MNRLEMLATAVKNHEGYFKPLQKAWLPLGSKSYRNNNPGNLRFDAYRQSLGADYEALGFAHFPNYETGWKALMTLLYDSITGKRKGLPYNQEQTIPEFFGVYSFIGWADQKRGIRKSNYTYANAILNEIEGITFYTKMKWFLEDMGTLKCPNCGHIFKPSKLI